MRTVRPTAGAVVAVGELDDPAEDVEVLPSSQRATPPWWEHVPEWCNEKL
jgi:hypothetical protein